MAGASLFGPTCWASRRNGTGATPPDMMAKLRAEFDFDFDHARTQPGSDARFDRAMGKRNWVNPPFTGEARRVPGKRKLGLWLCCAKRLPNAKNGNMTVLILRYNVRAI